MVLDAVGLLKRNTWLCFVKNKTRKDFVRLSIKMFKCARMLTHWCYRSLALSYQYPFTSPFLPVYTLKGSRCVFPFEYSGRRFYGCTTDFSSTGTPWCSMTAFLTEISDDWGFCNLDRKCNPSLFLIKVTQHATLQIVLVPCYFLHYFVIFISCPLYFI